MLKKLLLKREIVRTLIFVSLTCWLVGVLPAQDFKIGGFKMSYGHQPTGKLDTVKAEIVLNVNGVLKVIQGFIEREKYGYCGDRMPNGLPNSGGVYDDHYVTKRYLDENKNEIKEFIWLLRELVGKTSN